MRFIIRFVLAAGLLLGPWAAVAQSNPLGVWNNKQCAVVLTYDDAIDADLDKVIPALDSAKFRGTFYLGNHALMHPCDGSLPGRSFVTPDNDLSKYTPSRAVAEIRATNTLLKAIDGKTARTFAYPCGDHQIGGVNFYDQLKNDFVAARGVTGGLQTAAQVKLDDINCYSINGQSGQYMVDLVKQAQQSHTLLVFLFHGVGGGHALNVDLGAHRQLLRYLQAHEKEIYIAPMVEVAERIRVAQAGGAARK
jgi:peptidoglycan/xylan/chitin deacetylase (PgdA/CDA1 family)